MRLSAQTREYVPADVSGVAAGVRIDVSGDVVQMAFPVSEIQPVSGDWKAAIWETDTISEPDKYKALCLVGPGGTVALAANTYDVWVKVTHPPELLVRQALEPDGRPAKLVIY